MTVSTDDVAVLLGRALTGDEEDRADRLIAIAESLVEAELPGFSFASGTETASIVSDDPAVIWTPRYPVTAVSSVMIDGATLTSGDGYWWTDKGRIELSAAGTPWIVNSTWPSSPWPTCTVLYDYGLDPPPPVLAGVVAAMVAGALRFQGTNPGGVRSETIGSYSVAYAQTEAAMAAGGMVVPPLPARWQRNRTVSVPLTRL